METLININTGQVVNPNYYIILRQDTETLQYEVWMSNKTWGKEVSGYPSNNRITVKYGNAVEYDDFEIAKEVRNKHADNSTKYLVKIIAIIK